MKKYYVYCHCFSDSNEIFYIGKGTGNRLNSRMRNPHWFSVAGSRKYYSMKIKDGLTQDEAIELEDRLLREFQPSANIQHSSAKVKSIDYDVISKIVTYDESSPTFLRYLVDRANGAIKAGGVAGSFDSSGYGQVYIIDRVYKIHRIIFSLFSKKDVNRELVIDHIDGNKSNNNIRNLRLANHSQNARNVDWETVKPSNTGERGISLRDCYFRVLWSENQKQYEKSFNFGPRSGKTKEQAFQEAIAFRDSKKFSEPLSNSNQPYPHQPEEPSTSGTHRPS